jgi:hypothetical protein
MINDGCGGRQAASLGLCFASFMVCAESSYRAETESSYRRETKTRPSGRANIVPIGGIAPGIYFPIPAKIFQCSVDIVLGRDYGMGTV